MKPTPRPKRARKSSTVIYISLCLIAIFIVIITFYKVTEFIVSQNPLHSLPKLEISLAEIPIEEINAGPKDTKYLNNTAIFTIDGKSTTFNNVEIRGRGNSTWWQIKKPYQIKLPQKTSLFNLGAAKKWILLADYQDETHLRNDTAFFLSRLLQAKNSVGGRHLELYIDNVYYGLYYLSEKVEIDKNRLNLKDPSGVIVELDNLHNLDITCPLYSKGGDCLTAHDIVNPDLTDQAMNNFAEKLDNLGSATVEKDFTAISEIADVDSLAKYFLIKEFSNDQDAYGSSFFLYANGEEDKIHAGPVWDFDAAFGNKHLGKESKASSPLEDTIFKDTALTTNSSKVASDEHYLRISNIIYDLLDVPEFMARVREIYQSTLSGHGEELLNYIKNQAGYIRDAAYRDEARWKLKTDFDEEVDYLIDWVAKRYTHFEEIYGAANAQDEKNDLPENF